MINKVCSLFRNLYYKIRYGYKIDRAEAEMREWSVRLKAGGMPAFKEMMAQFKWHSDGGVEWIPDSPEIVVARGWKDDCDGAAVLAQWGFRQMNILSAIYRLDRPGGGHRVCVAWSKSVFTSNGSVVEIPYGVDWEHYVIEWGWHREMNYRDIERV